MNKEKRIFLILISICVIFALLLILNFQPEEKGWWIFKKTVYYMEYFAGIAFILTVVYVFALVISYRIDGDSLRWYTLVTAFFASGVLSILICFVFYKIWGILGFEKIEKGWWIFKTQQVVARDPMIWLADCSRAIAGPVEESAKLLALLLLPNVRKAINNAKTGLVLAVLCGLGFAMIENAVYFYIYKDILFLRANPGHAVFSGIWGIGLGKCFEGKIPLSSFFKYFLAGISLHAAWNYTIFFHGWIFRFIYIGVIAGAIYMWCLLRSKGAGETRRLQWLFRGPIKLCRGFGRSNK